MLRLVKRLLPRPWVERLHCLRVARRRLVERHVLLHPLVAHLRSMRAARQTAAFLTSTTGDVHLHLGCGGDLLPGWVNIDRVLPLRIPRNVIFVQHDLSTGIPLVDGSCELIYSSHFLEHLNYSDGLALLRECHRVLIPGGVVRASLPDYRKVCAAYLNRDRQFFDLLDAPSLIAGLEADDVTLADYFSYSVLEYGDHRYLWDAEKLFIVLKKLGFLSASESNYLPGVDPDSGTRRRYSFYVEATK